MKEKENEIIKQLKQIADNENDPRHQGLTSLIEKITVSTYRNLEVLSDKRLADELVTCVWSGMDMFSYEADLIMEAIERLRKTENVDTEVTK